MGSLMDITYMSEKIFFITKGKLKELKKEHDELVAFEHSKVMGEEAPRMFESEDINPEFISYHQDLDALRLRIEELKDIFDHHEIIKNPHKDQQHIVALGAKVGMEVNGKHNEFVITGTLEANPDLGKISNESLVGKALLGHKIGDEILISSPTKTKYKIKSIHYQVG